MMVYAPPRVLRCDACRSWAPPRQEAREDEKELGSCRRLSPCESVSDKWPPLVRADWWCRQWEAARIDGGSVTDHGGGHLRPSLAAIAERKRDGGGVTTMTTPSQMLRCATCSGTGTLRTTIGTGPNFLAHEKKCRVCDGHGTFASADPSNQPNADLGWPF